MPPQPAGFALLLRSVAQNATRIAQAEGAFAVQDRSQANAYVAGLARQATREGWLGDLVLFFQAQERNSALNRADRQKAGEFRAHAQTRQGRSPG